MEEWIKICFNLDKNGSYKKADHLFIKIASSLMSKQILIPGDVKATAKEAYDDRFGDEKFGTPKQIEIARQLKKKIILKQVIFLDLLADRNSKPKLYQNIMFLLYECNKK